MKKILFSLAALAAISMVAAGCKKASDAAKPETLEQKRVREGKAVFAAFDKVEAAAKKLTVNKNTGVKELHEAVKAYKAALETIKTDCGSIADVKTNVEKIKADTLEAASNALSEKQKGSNPDDCTDNVQAKIDAVTKSDNSGAVDKLKVEIDGIKAKAPYKKS